MRYSQASIPDRAVLEYHPVSNRSHIAEGHNKHCNAVKFQHVVPATTSPSKRHDLLQPRCRTMLPSSPSSLPQTWFSQIRKSKRFRRCACSAAPVELISISRRLSSNGKPNTCKRDSEIPHSTSSVILKHIRRSYWNATRRDATS